MLETQFELGGDGQIVLPVVQDQFLTGAELDASDYLILSMQLHGRTASLLVPKVRVVLADSFTCRNRILNIVFRDLTVADELERSRIELLDFSHPSKSESIAGHLADHLQLITVSTSDGGTVVAMGSWRLKEVRFFISDPRE